MKMIAGIEDPQVIRKILAHLEQANLRVAMLVRLEPRAPPRLRD